MSGTDAHAHVHAPVVAYRTYVLVWAALIVLTAVTVGVAYLPLAPFGTMAAIAIASAKSSLVVWFFMGLKYDRPVLRWMFLVTIVSFGVFLILTFVDYLTR
jgi:cytochrome c oxidase subunit 4